MNINIEEFLNMTPQPGQDAIVRGELKPLYQTLIFTINENLKLWEKLAQLEEKITNLTTEKEQLQRAFQRQVAECQRLESLRCGNSQEGSGIHNSTSSHISALRVQTDGITRDLQASGSRLTFNLQNGTVSWDFFKNVLIS
jgi:predicted nuclease with TOPRIM domain